MRVEVRGPRSGRRGRRGREEGRPQGHGCQEVGCSQTPGERSQRKVRLENRVSQVVRTGKRVCDDGRQNRTDRFGTT